MTKRIFRSICLVSMAVAVSCVILVASGLYSYFTKQQQSSLKILTEMAAEATEKMGIDYFDELELMGSRITWVDSSGKVLYDTLLNPDDMGSHLEREEIKEALSSGIGESIRYSDSLTEYQYYYAIRLSDNTVIRLSNSQSTVIALISDFAFPLVLIFIVVLLLSLLLAFRLSKAVVKPLNELDLDNPLQNKYYEEISPLINRIASQQYRLKKQESKLLKRQQEFTAVTEGMSEGLVLLSSKGIILSINKAAKELLTLKNDIKGKDFISQINFEEIKETVREGLFGNSSEDEFKEDGKIYSIKAEPVFTEAVLSGVILLILDITDKKESELRRREFTANVSHELKTPLHSISGYAELISEGLVQSKDIKDFGRKIYSESRRLLSLVEDILRLSRLDERENLINNELKIINLLEIAKKEAENLSLSADKQDDSIVSGGSEVYIKSNYTKVSEVVRNLLDNAVKYNKKGGKVIIAVAETEDKAVITVEDTGIGIAKEHVERIFERFYRVDKSHSREIGGTGLGLSIVKHGLMVLGGEISVESEVGKGTKVTVQLPK